MAAGGGYRQPRAVLAAACWISAAGALVFNVLPAFLGSAGDRYALSNEQIGWVGFSYGAGYFLITATSIVWIARVNWRGMVTVGAILAALSLVACALAPRYAFLLYAMAAAGLGCGALYTVGTAVVSENPAPDRAFGIKLAVETFVGVAMLIVLPSLIAERWGFPGVTTVLAAVAAVCGLLALRRIPSRREAGALAIQRASESRTSAGTGRNWLPWLGLGGLMVSFGGIAAVWGFLERIAPTFSLSAPLTAQIVLGTLVVNAFSGIAAALIGDRWGRVVPLAVSMLLAIVGVIVLTVGGGVYAYTAGAMLTYGTLSLPLSYQMGLIASADTTGRVASLIPAALALGGALAPAVAGSLLTGASYAPLYAFTAATMIAGLGAFLMLAHRLR
ncbi:MAG TPA: MFS transporter [Steroidobacteraceae bacterium]|jgi:predicted MFS family arabinose efflux permease